MRQRYFVTLSGVEGSGSWHRGTVGSARTKGEKGHFSTPSVILSSPSWLSLSPLIPAARIVRGVLWLAQFRGWGLGAGWSPVRSPAMRRGISVSRKGNKVVFSLSAYYVPGVLLGACYAV